MIRPNDMVSHEIAAANVLLGSSRFLTLWLPPAWDLAPGVGLPEIVASHARKGIKWVASGRAWYVIYHREMGWAMELFLQVSPRRRPKPTPTAEPLTVDGHEALVRWWERGRGFFRRRRITYMEVSFNCATSDRALRLEFSGRCGEEAFRDLLKSVPHWRCH